MKALIDFPNISIDLSEAPIDPPKTQIDPIVMMDISIDLSDAQINPLEASIDLPKATIIFEEVSNDLSEAPIDSLVAPIYPS